MKSRGYIPPKNFFEKHSGLWGFLSLILAILIFIGGFFSGKQYQLSISQDGVGDKIVMVNNGSGGLDSKVFSNTINQQAGVINLTQAGRDIYNVSGDIMNQPTKADEQKSQMQSDARTNLEAFFRRWERGDIENAYKQLDKQLATNTLFQTGNLIQFKNIYLKGGFYLDDLLPQGDCQSSDFIDRCEFNFTLRYVNKIWNKSIKEKRHAEMVINKDEFDYFKVGLLRCIDKNCENNPLFGTGD